MIYVHLQIWPMVRLHLFGQMRQQNELFINKQIHFFYLSMQWKWLITNIILKYLVDILFCNLLYYYISILTCHFSFVIFFLCLSVIIVILMQSIIDLAVSADLLSTALSIKDTYSTRNSGILGFIECTMWNNQFLLWALFVSSTWNIVTMTFERWVIMILY